MRKSALIFFFSLVFFSCEREKNYLIPENEIPEWLQVKINQDEQIIKDSPQLMNAYGAWLRYKWQYEYYFEYQNVLSESLPKPISANGDTLHFYIFDANTDYYKEKCCAQYVWKGPDYKAIK